MKYTREQIAEVMASKGYKYFTDNNNKGYDVNIIGIRNSDTKGRVTNAFDDTLTIAYKVEGEWQYHEFNCTTDPGSAYMNNPILENTGCAILKPNQYRGSHKLRLHAGKYLALGQKSAGCQVIADNDDWHEFLDICQSAREIHGNSFSYTLLESKDIA